MGSGHVAVGQGRHHVGHLHRLCGSRLYQLGIFSYFPTISSRTYPVGLDWNNPPESPDFEKEIQTYFGPELTLYGRALISSKHSNVSDPNKQNKIIQDVLT